MQTTVSFLCSLLSFVVQSTVSFFVQTVVSLVEQPTVSFVVQTAVSFLNRFQLSDISVVSFNGESTSIWGISEPAQKDMIEALQKPSITQPKLEFSMSIVRCGCCMCDCQCDTFKAFIVLCALISLFMTINDL